MWNGNIGHSKLRKGQKLGKHIQNIPTRIVIV